MTRRTDDFRRGLNLSAVDEDVRAEIREEIQFYLERRSEEFIAEGIPEAEAWRRAVEAFGDPGEVEDVCRDISESDGTKRRLGEMMHSILQDIRFGVRGFARRPTFTATAFLTIALGVGATTTMFSVVDGVLLSPLPYDEPEQLMSLGMDWSGEEVDRDTDRLRLASASNPNLIDWKAGGSSFQAMGGVVLGSEDLMGSDTPERVSVGLVTDDFFPALRQSPRIGRLFSETEYAQSADVVVLSHGIWERRYGADPNIIGRTIESVEGRYEVVGVFPPEVKLPEAIGSDAVELWAPLALNDERLADRGTRSIDVIGRLASGVGIDAARAEMDALSHVLAEQYPDVLIDSRTGEPDMIGVSPLLRQTVGDVRPALFTLLGAVGFLLLIACTNVANLFVARGTDRLGEISLRTALGAGKRRLSQQLMTESLVLAIAGGIAGLGVAVVGLNVFQAIAPASVPRMAEVTLDGRVLGFALLLSTFVGCVFGLGPVVQAARQSASEGMKEGARGGSSRGAARIRGGLVAFETGLAVILLTGAGLLANSFVRLTTVDPGFSAENLTELRVRTRGGFAEMEQNFVFYGQLEETLAAIPGVEGVTATSNLPVGPTNWRTGATTENGRFTEEDPLVADGIMVSPGYFASMGIPAVAGREFDRSDNTGPAAVVINQSFADEAFPGQSAVGQRIHFGSGLNGGQHWHTIVGVVGDVKQAELAAEGSPAMFVAWGHFTWPSQSFVIRSTLPAGELFPAVRAAFWSVDPTLPIAGLRTIEDRISASIVTPKFMALLLGTFAVLSVVLAAVGIFGTTAYSVGRRRREVGIRIAMGADGAEVARLMTRQGFTVVVVGLVLGVAGSLVLSRALADSLYGITGTDPATFIAVASVLGLVGLVACWVPARRAATVGPAETLRSE